MRTLALEGRTMVVVTRKMGFTRAELVDHVQRHYTGANLVVGVAGDVDADQVVAEAAAAFGGMPRGSENLVAAPDYVGGIRARRLPGAARRTPCSASRSPGCWAQAPQ